MADINVYGTMKTMAGDGKVAVTSQVFDEAQQKFQSEINQGISEGGYVSAKAVQSFTTAEKERARANIDALGSITQAQFNAIFND